MFESNLSNIFVRHMKCFYLIITSSHVHVGVEINIDKHLIHSKKPITQHGSLLRVCLKAKSVLEVIK